MVKLDILVIEDNPLAQELLGTHLGGHSVDFASNAEDGRKRLSAGRYDLCFIDLKLGEDDDCSGLKLIPIAAGKRIYSVVMSSHDSEPIVEKAYALGCDDFYAKGNVKSNVDSVLRRFMRKRSASDPKDDLFEARFVTADPATKASIAETLKYAASDLPVLILGPSGTGKTSLARVIHDHSARQGEFVAINCSSYTEELLEGELFGYRKGAFTGATENRKGKLLLADKGTLFLDEIGSMSLTMQTKLLKAIEERSFSPLGSEKPETSQFRLISATLEDLPGLVKAGKLRFDFFQRIHGWTVELKPLAQRTNDIFPLISCFTRGARRLSFSADAKALLLRHDWPGNVRELKKLVELLSAGDSGKVTPEALHPLLTRLRVKEGAGFATEEQYRYTRQHGLEATLRRVADTLIKRSMAENDGKKTKVIEELGTNTRTLYNALRRMSQPEEAA